MQKYFSEKIKEFPKEKKYIFTRDSSLSFFVLNASNIKNTNEVKEVMRLGYFTNTVFSIVGELKKPVCIIVNGENIEVKEAYLLSVKFPSIQVECLTMNKKEIDTMISEKTILLI